MPVAGKAEAPTRIRAGRRRLVERRPDHSAKHSRAVLCVRITSELRTRQDAWHTRANDPPRTRAWNLRLRGPTLYPLGQRTYVHGQAPRSPLCTGINTKSLMPIAGTAKAPMRIRAGRRRLVERRPDHSAKHSRAALCVQIASELRTRQDAWYTRS